MAIHIFDDTDNNIRVIADDYVTGDAVERTYTIPNATDIQGMAYDSVNNEIHVADWRDDNIRVIGPDTVDGGQAVVLRTYTVPGAGSIAGLTFDGTNIHVLDQIDDNVRVIATNTADGAEATVLRTYTISEVSSPRAATFDGTNIQLGDSIDDDIYVVSLTHSSGAADRVYGIQNVENIQAMTFDGTYLHVSDSSSDLISVIGLNHVNGAAAIRSYEVTGVGNARGMTHVPSNRAPTFSEDPYTFTNIAITVGAVVGTVIATDPDGDTITYTLGGTDVARFSRATNGQITTSQALAYNTTYTFTVTANDGTADTVVDVNVTTVAAPAVATTLQIVSGNNQSGKISTLLAQPLVVVILDQYGDPFPGAPVGFSTTGGTLSAASVTTGVGGQASVALVLPATAGDYTITASATGLTDVTFTATAHLNRVPVFSEPSYSFTDIHESVGTSVGTITATDADNDPITYSLSGTDASLFDVNDSGEITVESVLTRGSSYSFNIVASDGEDTVSASVTVSPRPANRAPVFSESSYSFTDIHESVGTSVGTITATDADNDPITYSLTGTNASLFGVNSSGQITVDSVLARGTNYSFNLVANDTITTTSVPITVATRPANRAPVFSRRAYSFTDIATATGSVVGTVMATDEDNDTLTYTLTGTNASNFAVSATGQITISIDLAISGSYSFFLNASDGTVTTTVSVEVEATSVVPNTPPMFPQMSYTFSEIGLFAGDRVGEVIASDAEADVLTYTLTGTDADKFIINNGEIIIAEDLTRDTAYSFNVVANDGTATSSVSVSLRTVTPATSDMFTEQNGDVVFNAAIYGIDDVINNRTKFKVYVPWDKVVTGLTISDFTIATTQEHASQNIRHSVQINNITGSKRLFAVECEVVLGSRDLDRRFWGTITFTLAENAVDQGNTSQVLTFKWYCVYVNDSNQNQFSPFEEIVASLPTTGQDIHTTQLSFDNNLLYRTSPNSGTVYAYDPETGAQNVSENLTFGGQYYNLSFATRLGGYMMVGTRSNVVNYIDLSDTSSNALFTYALTGANLTSFFIGKDYLFYNRRGNRKVEFPNPNVTFEVPTRTVRHIGEDTPVEIDSNGVRSQGYVIRGYDGHQYYYATTSYLMVLLDENFRILPETAAFLPTNESFSTYIAQGKDEAYMLYGFGLFKFDKGIFFKPRRRQLIYPIFVEENSTLDLNKYVEGAEKYVWDFDFEPHSALTLSGTNLQIGTVTEETAIQVKLRAVNKKGITDENEVKFYIIVRKESDTPQWVNLVTLSADEGQVIDLRDYVTNADSVALTTGPTGTTLSDFDLTIGDTEGSITLAATKGSNTVSVTFQLNIVSEPVAANLTSFKYKAFIAGIDVSDDLIKRKDPVISESLDPVEINEYIVDSSSFALKYKQGYYSYQEENNFWESNNLNPSGYREQVRISVEYPVGNALVEKEILFGIIMNVKEDIPKDMVIISVNDASYNLKNKLSNDLSDIGIQKYARAFISPNPTYEGVYPLESSMLPIFPKSAEVWSGSEKLTVKHTRNPSEGVLQDNSVYVNTRDIRSQGGTLDSVPVIKYNMPYRHKTAKFFVNLLARIGEQFNPSFNITNKIVDRDCIQSKGNIQYNVQNTRITHIVRDWVYDSVDEKIYILLSQPDKNYKDILVEHDIETDEQVVLTEFDEDKTGTRLAYFSGVFYIMMCDSIELDRSRFPVPRDSYEILYKLDAQTGADSTIIKYTRATDTKETLIPDTSDNKPQAAGHYQAGFFRERGLLDFQGVHPDTRTKFKVNNNLLYYRYCNEDNYGICSLTRAGVVSELITESVGFWKEHLKFDFDISSTGDIYFAHVEQSTTGSTLKVQRRRGSTTSDFLSVTRTFSSNQDNVPDLPNQGSWFSGVNEVILVGTDLYLSVEIGRTDIYYTDADKTTPRLCKSQQKGAGQTIYKIDTTSATPSLEIIAKYDFVQSGARSLTAHNNELYFIESPSEHYKYGEFNPDITESFSLAFDSNVEVRRGALKRVDSNDIVTDLGGLWYTNTHFRGTPAKALSIGNSLHFIAHYGNTDHILRTNIQTSRVDNFQWIKYGRELEFILERVPQGNVYNVLVDIAKKINGLFSTRQNRIYIDERVPITGRLSASLNDSANTLSIENLNREIPSEGYILIDNEVISYTGKTSTTLTGLTRGVNKSKRASHSNKSQIIYLDNVIDPAHYLKRSFSIDTNRVYNIIQSPNLILEQRDQDSIDALGERIYPLDLGLTIHDECWIDYIYSQYLQELKDVKNFVILAVSTSFELQLGDIVSYHFKGEVKAMRIVNVTYHRGVTQISGRTL